MYLCPLTQYLLSPLGPSLAEYEASAKRDAYKDFKASWNNVSDRAWSPQCYCMRHLQCNPRAGTNRTCSGSATAYDWEALVHCEDLTTNGTMPNFQSLVVNTLLIHGSANFAPGIFRGAKLRVMTIRDNVPRLTVLRKEDL